jgi:hypothetical protein
MRGKSEGEEGADQERGVRGDGSPPGMLAELYNWPHVGQLERGGHAGDQRPPPVTGQPGQPRHRQDRSDSAKLSGRAGNRESGPGSGQSEQGLAKRPEPRALSPPCWRGQMSAHDYNCNESGPKTPENCKESVTFAIRARQSLDSAMNVRQIERGRQSARSSPRTPIRQADSVASGHAPVGPRAFPDRETSPHRHRGDPDRAVSRGLYPAPRFRCEEPRIASPADRSRSGTRARCARDR